MSDDTSTSKDDNNNNGDTNADVNNLHNKYQNYYWYY